MKIGLVGATSQESSLPFNAERTVNLYPVIDQSGKEVAALYGTDGLELLSTIGTGPIRNEFSAANERAFVVSGATLYELNSDGTYVSRGSLSSSNGNITIDENGFQLGICDGQYVYMFTYATNAFVMVSDLDLPQSGTITFIDGYFVVNKLASGAFYISGLYNGLTWSALDFATAESSPDVLLRPISAAGQLFLLGSSSGEIWTNTGDSTFPFQRISGAKMEMGILAPHTAVSVDNSLVWLGRDKNGQGIVYRANGFTPQRISTEAIELKIQTASNAENMRGFTYQCNGHTFYLLTGAGMETSLVYDFSTKVWHERAYLNSIGGYEEHRASCSMFAFGKVIVGDRDSGNVYVMSPDVYSDNGEDICRERIYTHLGDEGKRLRYNRLEVHFETGVGLQNGQGQYPLASLRLSKDGARTWSDYHTASIGAVGKYRTKVQFRRLGIADQMTFSIRVTDQVKVAICGSYLF